MKNSVRKLFCLSVLLIMLCGVSSIAFASSKININRATVTELVAIKGIGPKTAASIIEYRDKHGDFASIDIIVNVKGIGEKTFAKLADQITVEVEKTQ